MDRTAINPELSGEETALNREAAYDGEETAINPAVFIGVSVSPGDILFGRYEVREKMNAVSGEADLYLCTYDGETYVAKIYRRKDVKSEAADKLAGIRSPYIARIFESGEYKGFRTVILPYYANGSLQGRTFSPEELKTGIIPALNEGLKVLHDNGIIHKDLKPSNIMLCDDGRSVAIIDFGVSSVRRDDNTVIMTRTGMTPNYAAPETFRDLFLNESDYYSLGITVEELYTGENPFVHLDRDEIERILTTQNVPLPPDMPEDLKVLIRALTYHDLAYRHDKANPNRRWTYEEVRNWCAGIPQPVPGTSAGNSLEEGRIRPYRFRGVDYTDVRSLVLAFNRHWEDGKKQLFRGLLSAYYKQFDAEMAGLCMDAEEEAHRGDEDVLFFRILYDMDLDLTDLLWKGYRYSSLEEIGRQFLGMLRESDGSLCQLIDELLEKGVLSAYYGIQNENRQNSQTSALRSLETMRRAVSANSREELLLYFRLAYILSGDRNLEIGGQTFRDPDQLTAHMNRLLDRSTDAFNDFCALLINDYGVLNEQFEGWLIVLGKRDAVERWKQSAAGG